MAPRPRSGRLHVWRADGRPLRVLLSSERARYVKLQLTERTYLHLDKVFVL